MYRGLLSPCEDPKNRALVKGSLIQEQMYQIIFTFGIEGLTGPKDESSSACGLRRASTMVGVPLHQPRDLRASWNMALMKTRLTVR